MLGNLIERYGQTGVQAFAALMQSPWMQGRTAGHSAESLTSSELLSRAEQIQDWLVETHRDLHLFPRLSRACDTR